MNRLAFRISLYMTLAATVMMLLVSAYGNGIARQAVLKGTQDDVRDLTLAVQNHIEGALKGAKKIPELFAEVFEHRLTDIPLASYSWLIGSETSDIHNLVKSIIARNEEIYGICIAFEPDMFQPGRRLAAPYFHRIGNDVRFTGLVDTADYFASEWYAPAAKKRMGCWSEPYFDEDGGKILMVTYSQPLFVQQGTTRKFAGVIAIDVSLEWLRKTIASSQILETGYAFLLSKGGKYITHPDPDMIMKTADVAAWKTPGLRNAPQLVPMYPEGWVLGIVVPEDELYFNLNWLTARIVGFSVLGFMALFLVVVLVSDRLVTPLRVLATTATELGKGNLEIEFPVDQNTDEVRLLACSLASMRNDLKKHIADVVEITGKQQRILSDLATSRTIQMGMLRKDFSEFTSKTNVGFHAFLRPAKEVGGDLYDFFQTDDNHVFFAIGDVSGKGVSAALFMAMAITLLRARARSGSSPAEILTAINTELCKGNENSMYVTFFLGKLDIHTGLLQYSNLGHPFPYLIKKGVSEPLKGQHGVPVGLFEDVQYSSGEITMKPGESLVLYTDGVSEANDKNRGFYGTENLEKALAEPFPEPEALVRRILTSVDSFAEGAEQFDDITIEVVTFNG